MSGAGGDGQENEWGSGRPGGGRVGGRVAENPLRGDSAGSYPGVAGRPTGVPIGSARLRAALRREEAAMSTPHPALPITPATQAAPAR